MKKNYNSHHLKTKSRRRKKKNWFVKQANEKAFAD